MKIALKIVSALVLVLMLVTSCVGKDDKSTTSKLITVLKEKQGPGDAWLSPEQVTVKAGDSFETTLFVNSGKQKLAAYGVTLMFDKNLLEVDQNVASTGVSEGPDGNVAAVNPKNEGKLIFSGFDAYGKGPGAKLEVATISWKAKKAGKVMILVEVMNLIDEVYKDIGSPAGYPAEIVIE